MILDDHRRWRRLFSYMMSSLFITQSLAEWIGNAGRQSAGC